MSNNIWTVIFIVFFLVLISTVANDLGITTDVISPPEIPDAPETSGFFDALTGVITWAFNTVGSFFQLLTFQANIPPVINSLIMLPLSFGVLYLIIVIIRGGAG